MTLLVIDPQGRTLGTAYISAQTREDARQAARELFAEYPDALAVEARAAGRVLYTFRPSDFAHAAPPAPAGLVVSLRVYKRVPVERRYAPAWPAALGLEKPEYREELRPEAVEVRGAPQGLSVGAVQAFAQSVLDLAGGFPLESTPSGGFVAWGRLVELARPYGLQAPKGAA